MNIIAKIRALTYELRIPTEYLTEEGGLWAPTFGPKTFRERRGDTQYFGYRFSNGAVWDRVCGFRHLYGNRSALARIRAWKHRNAINFVRQAMTADANFKHIDFDKVNARLAELGAPPLYVAAATSPQSTATSDPEEALVADSSPRPD